jgi:hypothetical protein
MARPGASRARISRRDRAFHILRAVRSTSRGTAPTSWAALAVAASLALFLAKAFHIDEPLFLWTARQIAAAPGDFFGFELNWFGYRTPMPTAMMNPPLLGYYLAATQQLLGSSEIAVHAAMLVFPLAAAVGTASIARRMGTDPATALVATAATPAFLASGTSAMSDMMMLAFWVWAVDQWILGVREARTAALLRSGMLVAGATIAKYFGIALIPLLAAHALAARRSGNAPPVLPLLAAVAIPLTTLLVYERVTGDLYGAPHFASAMAYAGRTRSLLAFSPLGSALVGLTFAGGCLASALCFAPLLWSWRAIAAGLALGAMATALVAARPELGGSPFLMPGELGGLLLVQVAVLAAAGASILVLASLDLLRSRDAEAILLALWVTGTFAFAAFLTWSNSARVNLPMAPALGLLVARRLASRPVTRGSVGGAALASLVLALGVTYADARLAGSAREAAERIADRYGGGEGRLWFFGHWGFQYYLEERGGRAIDVQRSRLLPGDVVAIPSNNSNVFSLPRKRAEQLETIEVAVPRWLTPMNVVLGAGFYSSVFGPLPWAFGAVPAERYEIFAVRRPIQFPPRSKLRSGIH